MAGKGVVPFHLRLNLIRFTENIDGRIAFDDARTQCVICTVANEQDEVVRVFDVILEMMADAAAFAHAGGANDDRRSLDGVECDRLRDLSDGAQVLHAKGVVLFAQEIVNFLIEAFRVQPKNFRGINAKGTVYKNWYIRQVAAFVKLVQAIYN